METREKVAGILYRLIQENALPQLTPEYFSLSRSPGPKDLGINSMKFLQLMIAVEKEFGIEVDDDHWTTASFPSVASLLDYIMEKSSGF